MASPSPAESRPPESLQLVCAEIWGGNRPADTPIELPGVRGRLFSHPADGGRGGDVHYLSVCGSGLLARMCLADVVGHGEAVARFSTEMHAQLRRYMSWPDQRRVLSGLNRRLEQIGLDAMTTAATLTYYPPSGKLSVSYAGHPPGWYYHSRHERWERLTVEGDDDSAGPSNAPLAIDPNTSYSRRHVRVCVGDRLLLVTDGVLEAFSPDGRAFGEQGLERCLSGHRRDEVPEQTLAIRRALAEHVGHDNFAHDDVTLLLVEFVPGPRGPALWHVLKNRLFPPHGNSGDPAFAATTGA